MIGKTVSHYRILERLGEGGMGVVYKAEDTRLGRVVALKFLPPELTRRQDAKERFVNEARAASALDHPNICTIHEIDETDDGQMFICMAYYEGESVKDKMNRGALDIEHAVGIAAKVCRGLVKAHARGMVHRDIKPANILVTSDDQVKIVDFGLAKLVGDTTVTETGTTIGTAAYMSPEQARGQPADHRSDIWSLGVVLYEMLTGRAPFTAEYAPAVIYAILHDEPKRLSEARPDAPPELGRIIGKAMTRGVSERYQSADDLLADLNLVAEKLGSGAAKRDGARERGLPSIAVLPLVDMSPKGDQEYFCDGMAEELISALTKLGRLRVASRTSAFQFKGRDQDIRRIGEQLDVGTVLEGSVRKAGNRLRITAQLVSVADGYHLWSEKYDRDMEDIFAIQDEISLAILEKLKVKLLGEERAELVKRRTRDLEAYNLYLQGRYYWNRRYEGGLKKAIEFFQQAIERDPAYALPYVGIADAFNILGYYGFLPRTEAFPKAKGAALKALEIDDKLGEAHASLGWVATFYDWDWPAAEREFGRALEMNPNYATAHEWYALYLAAMGRFDEALAEATRARELDPLSLVINSIVAAIFYLSRRYDEAIEQFHKTIDMDPNFVLPWIWLGETHISMGEYGDAVEELESAVALAADMTYAVGQLSTAYGLAGRGDDARKMLVRLDELAAKRYVSPFHKVLPHMGLGEIDAAFEHIEKAISERASFLLWLKVAPILDPLRPDPRFAAALDKVGFEP